VKDPDIVEVARQSGVPASTLRFYEEKGLVASVGRRGLKRLFDPGIFERLALISLARASGFSLDEIRDMLAADGRPSFDRARLTAKAEELDHTIQRLTAMREGLRHAAACPAPSLMECPTFRRMVRLAGAGAFEPPPKQAFKAEQVTAPALPAAASSAAPSRRR
jgi:DNA-binding transcriptional MerR regulator